MNTSRRSFVLSSLGALGLSLILKPSSSPAQTPQLPKPTQDLAPTDPLATSLGYFEKASAVDTKKWPKKAGPEGAKQNCLNCGLYVKFPGEAARGGCALFVGKWVKAEAWCNGWVPAPKK